MKPPPRPIAMGRRFFPLALVLAVLTGTSAVALAADVQVRLRDAGGGAVVTARDGGDTVEVRDGKDQVVARIKVEADRVKLRDAKDVERWKIKKKEYGAEIEDGAGQRLFRIRRDGPGAWKVEDAAKVVLARVKPKDSGVEVRDGRGATLAKVKPREGKLVFESETGERLFDLTGTVDAGAGLWFALDRFSLAERAAVWAFFARVRP